MYVAHINNKITITATKTTKPHSVGMSDEKKRNTHWPGNASWFNRMGK